MSIKDKFILSKENLEYIMNTFILVKHKDIEYNIRLSNTTSSIYLYITRLGTTNVLRFSDHKNSKSKSFYNKTYIIDPSFCNGSIVNIIEKRLKELDYKRLYFLLNNTNK